MKATRFALSSLFFVSLVASASLAQGVQRTFVSGLGSDSNPCSRTAPCRNFTAAIGQTNAGGEVIVLDSAGYGIIHSITKSISIVAPPGVYAGISVFSFDGIDINGGSTDTVVLRGLTVTNLSGPINSGVGIMFNAGGTLHVENCFVSGFQPSAGLAFVGPGKLEVKDSTFKDSGDGIVVTSGSGTALAAIDGVTLEGNTNGLLVEDGSQVVVRNSVASGNGTGFNVQPVHLDAPPVKLNLELCTASNNGTGVFAASSVNASAEVNVESCVISSNTLDGIFVVAGSTGVVTARVSNSMITNNVTGLQNGGAPAILLSRGNNTVEGNGTDTVGAIGSYMAK